MQKRLVVVADKLLYLTSFIIPLIFLPQVIVLLTQKSTDGLSLLTLVLSAVVQGVMLFKSVVCKERAMMISVLSSLIPLSFVIMLVIYCRYVCPLF